MSGCKSKRDHSVMSWRDIDAAGTQYGQTITRWCVLCRDHVPWGPTPPDTEAVRVERRAAELAATWNPDDTAWNGFESLGMVSPDGQHADLIERDVHEKRKSPHDLFAYLSGHLARVIADHDDEQPAPGMDRESGGGASK